jgi:hypothetical protein
VGGASEIALNIIPIIERAGGKVLVRANVTEILVRSFILGTLINPGKIIYYVNVINIDGVAVQTKTLLFRFC